MSTARSSLANLCEMGHIRETVVDERATVEHLGGRVSYWQRRRPYATELFELTRLDEPPTWLAWPK